MVGVEGLVLTVAGVFFGIAPAPAVRVVASAA
ncbi:hypothetical protein BJ965_007167 [Streptomyces luteogriseus]|uniref:Uncharacterized protein n=1 Tax=Streptomyces luteogriseus TaxID=68233 RepID=A0A7W7DWK7_9ACTN|nr:hypothetical protein [Streptomyces luteogriseus]